MPVVVREIEQVLEAAYPVRLAEEWDTGIGLTCGDDAAEVTRILLAVDVDPATVAQAQSLGAQLLVTHHPMLFRPVQTVAAGTDKGAMVHTLIRSGIAHFAAHTNADRAVGGVADALAEVLGVVDTRPLIPASLSRPDADPREGLGRVGSVADPVTLAEFAAAVAHQLPRTAWGVRAAGDPTRLVRRVAVCGGSGGSALDAASACGADVFVTSDITHHTAAEHVADPTRPALIDVAHWAGEWPWLPKAAEVLRDALGDAVAVTVSTLCTDAWTLQLPSAAHRV